MASAADPLADTLAAVLVPIGVSRTVHINIDPYGCQAAGATRTIASRAVAATDVGVSSDEECQDEAQGSDFHCFLRD